MQKGKVLSKKILKKVIGNFTRISLVRLQVEKQLISQGYSDIPKIPSAKRNYLLHPNRMIWVVSSVGSESDPLVKTFLDTFSNNQLSG